MIKWISKTQYTRVVLTPYNIVRQVLVQYPETINLQKALLKFRSLITYLAPESDVNTVAYCKFLFLHTSFQRSREVYDFHRARPKESFKTVNKMLQ